MITLNSMNHKQETESGMMECWVQGLGVVVELKGWQQTLK